MTIFFYDPRQKNGYLATFSRHPITLDGCSWKTVEHFFQAQKFIHDDRLFGAIRKAPTPLAAKKLARQYKVQRRTDWNDVRESVMRRGIRAKFTQHDHLRKKLIRTGSAPIVERTDDDTFWAVRSDGVGENRLGKIIMDVRKELMGARKELTDNRLKRGV